MTFFSCLTLARAAIGALVAPRDLQGVGEAVPTRRSGNFVNFRAPGSAIRLLLGRALRRPEGSMRRNGDATLVRGPPSNRIAVVWREGM